MKKSVLLLCLLGYSLLALADSTGALNFTPPPGDVSVGFLADMFGVVDGVLDGNATQIIGKMFEIFNSAVLALAGLLVAYTLVVSTMNTAHEGEVLGKQWSSIWIPVRSSIGLALLLPKSSGYCAAQVFVMWLVVQGVGAADKIWDTVLDYLGSGGVIIAQSENTSSSSSDNYDSVTQMAGGILSGQVCMLTMEYQFNALKKYAASGSTASGGGKCGSVQYNASNSSSTNANQYAFCNFDVPDFINSVDFSNPKTSSGRSYVSMPYFQSTSNPSCDSNSCVPPNDAEYYYKQLNGLCGYISWANLTSSDYSGDIDSANDTITTAISEMYQSLLNMSQSMVEDSLFGSTDVISTTEYQSYGFPRTNAGNACTPTENASVTTCTGSDTSSDCDSDYSNSDACLTWGGIDGAGAVFTGEEVNNSVSSFIGLVNPILNTMATQADDGGDTFSDLTDFIDSAQSQGWIMAGSYFFNLANLNNYTSSLDNTAGISTFALASANECSSGSSNYDGTKTQYSTAGITCANSAVSDVLSLASSSMTQSIFFDSVSNMVSAPFSSTKVTPNPMTDLPSIPISSDDTFQYATSVSPTVSYTDSSVPSTVQMCTGSPYQDLILSSTSASSFLSAYTCVNQPITNSAYAIYNNSNALYIPSTNVSSPTSLDIPVIMENMNNNFEFSGSSYSGGKEGIARSIVNWTVGWIVDYWKDLLNDAAAAAAYFVYAIVSTPLYLSAYVFTSALAMLTNVNVNPITSLGVIGVSAINGIGSLWYTMALVTGVVAAIPIVNVIVPPILLIVSPIVFSWYAVLFSMGVICAYFIPFLPYMVFTFASIGWFVGVIEAMVAAPIVALGVATPEGHQALGKATQAVMIILNVFLRPSLMILGYIFGFGLSYIGIWLVNAGFNRIYENLESFTEAVSTEMQTGYAGYMSDYQPVNWTLTFVYLFGIVTYVAMLMQVVIKSYDLIHVLPDKITRWLTGGQQEHAGSEQAQVVREVKQQVQEGGKELDKATQESSTQFAKVAEKAAGYIPGFGGGDGSVK